MINWELLKPANIAVIGIFTIVWFIMIEWMAKQIAPQSE